MTYLSNTFTGLMILTTSISSEAAFKEYADNTRVREEAIELSEMTCKNAKSTQQSSQTQTINGESTIENLTEPEAQFLFNKIVEFTSHEIPFRIPDDSCYARAHRMAELLEKSGIDTIKVTVEGRMRVTSPNAKGGVVPWKWHIVPAICVTSKSGAQLFVIDPSLMNQAVPLTEWTERLSEHPSSLVTHIYTMTRYSYKRSDKTKPSKPRFMLPDLIHVKSKLQDYKLRELIRFKEDIREWAKNKTKAVIPHESELFPDR